MPLRSYDYVRAIPGHCVEEPRRLLGVDVEVPVQEHDILAGGRLEPGHEGRALAAVPLADDGAHDDVFVLALRRALELRACSVRRAVVHWNELRAQSMRLEELRRLDEVVEYLRSEVVHGHDNGEPAGTDRLACKRPLFRELCCAFCGHRENYTIFRASGGRSARVRPQKSRGRGAGGRAPSRASS